MKLKSKIILFIIAGLLIGGGVYLIKHNKKSHVHAVKQQYTCPMHPQIIRDDPGDCPICGMKLVPLKKDNEGGNANADKPGNAFSWQMPNDMAPVKMNAQMRDQLGVTFGKVETREIKRVIRSAARIVPIEGNVYKVNSRVEGWIDKLMVSRTGELVRKGMPLYTIYSPELMAAQQEYLSAMAAEDKVGSIDSDNPVARNIKSLQEAALGRLEILGISKDDIAKMKSTGKPVQYVSYISPADGFVTEKNIFPGQKISTNDLLFTISDLSIVWGEAEVSESDIPFVKDKAPVILKLSYWPDKTFKGNVDYIYPFLQPENRTLKVRIKISNNEFLLKPEMFASAEISVRGGVFMAIPEGSLFRSGLHDYVFVADDDQLIPVKVTVVIKGDDGFYGISSGLKGDEVVVTSAGFLIDSESSLKGAMQSTLNEGK